MSIETFVTQLQEGKYSEAVDTLKTHLKEQSDTIISESKAEVLSIMGFKLDEKKSMKEEDDSGEDESDDKKKDESDDSDEDESDDDKKKDKKENPFAKKDE